MPVRIHWQQLGLNRAPDEGVLIRGEDTLANLDGLTSTVVIYSVP